MRFSHLGAVALVCALPLAGQQSSPKVVTIAAPAARPALTLSAAPLAEGRDDEHCPLGSVVGMESLSDGKLVVADARQAGLCLFDATGRFMRVVGRRGNGPGEFRAIASIDRLPGDSILVFDSKLGRLSVVSPAGAVVRSIPVPRPTTTGNFTAVLVRALPDGTFLAGWTDRFERVPSPESVRLTLTLHRVDRTGKPLGPVGTFTHRMLFIQEQPGPPDPSIAFWDLAFGRRLSLVAAKDGFLAGDGSAATVTLHGVDGRALVAYRGSAPPRRVTPADIAAYRRDALAEAEPAGRAKEERRVKGMPFPATFPAYRALVLDRAGRLWLDPEPSPADAGRGTEWAVWELAAGRSFRVMVPAGFRPMAGDATRICGIVTDDDGAGVACYGVAVR